MLHTANEPNRTDNQTQTERQTDWKRSHNPAMESKTRGHDEDEDEEEEENEDYQGSAT